MPSPVFTSAPVAPRCRFTRTCTPRSTISVPRNVHVYDDKADCMRQFVLGLYKP